MSAGSIRRPHFGFESSLIGRQTVRTILRAGLRQSSPGLTIVMCSTSPQKCRHFRGLSARAAATFWAVSSANQVADGLTQAIYGDTADPHVGDDC